MEVVTHREILKDLLIAIKKELDDVYFKARGSTYLIISHQAPRENAHLLVEWDLIDTAGKIRAMAVDDVLEVLAEAKVERLQIDFSLYDFEQSVELINRQIFNDCLRHGGDLFLGRALRQGLVDEVAIDLLQRGVASVDQVSQILNRWGLVLDQNEDQMQRQGRQSLTITSLVDSTDVWDALKTII